MGSLVKFLTGKKGKVTLLAQESDIESHLDVMAMWLHHEDTLAIVKSIPEVKYLYDKMVSDRNIIIARLRTLRFAIKAYEEGYESIITTSRGRDVTFVPFPHPNSNMMMQNQIHLIDVTEQNFIKNIRVFVRLIKENARLSKKASYLTHVAVIEEAVGNFSRSFDEIEKAIDSLVQLKKDVAS